MRRTFGLIALIAALGTASAPLAQQQPQQDQRDNYIQNDGIRREQPPAEFSRPEVAQVLISAYRP